MPDKVDEVHRPHNEHEGTKVDFIRNTLRMPYPEVELISSTCLQCKRYEKGLRRLIKSSYSGYTMDTTAVRKEIRKILRSKP